MKYVFNNYSELHVQGVSWNKNKVKRGNVKAS